MLSSDWSKNVIRFVPHTTGCYACFGDVHKSDMTTGSTDLPSALALLAVRMARESWECDPGNLPFSAKGEFLAEGSLVIEYKGTEVGWVAEFWMDGDQDHSVGACHITHPEVAVATVALMVANPDFYEESE